MRPSRLLLQAAIIGNAALIGAWVMSRTVGLPFGEHAWHAEAVTFVDATCVALEVALIVTAGLLLFRPQVCAIGTNAVAVAVPIAALALTTAALASPSARDHASGAHGVHGDAHVVDDKGLSLLTNGHHAEIVQQELDAPTQAALDTQLDVSREVAALYPTVTAAEAAGYKRVGPYFPGIGAHYIQYGAGELNPDGVIEGDDARHPMALIYTGTEPDAEIAGFMYYSMSATEPEGFAGPNDVWHYHEQLCLKFGANGVIDAPFGLDNEATEAQCASAGGSMLRQTQWMLHVWSVPGYDNIDGGTFAEVNPALDCPDGTYYRLPPEEWAAHPVNVCRSEG
jgi:hypothetical protein